MSGKTVTGKRIVVGVDGSSASVDALRWAGRIGAALGVELLAVASWAYPVSYGLGGGDLSGWRPDVDTSEALGSAVDLAFGETKPLGLLTEVRQGHPAKVLLEVSDGAEMLVLGSRGHGGFTGLLLGSVSAHCAELATCPVVVVHTDAADHATGDGSVER